MAVTFLLSIALMVASCFAREFDCTSDASLCTGNGAQSIMVAGQRMCCPPTATFSLNNNVCKCVVADPAELRCAEGIAQCRQATTFGTDSQGRLRCCSSGYSLRMVSSNIANAGVLDDCACTLQNQNSGGFANPFLGGGGETAPAQNANDTAVRSEWERLGSGWRNWGNNFGSGFRTWGETFARDMRHTGLGLARGLSSVLQSSIGHSMVPIGRAFTNMLGNAFNAIPGFQSPRPAIGVNPQSQNLNARF